MMEHGLEALWRSMGIANLEWGQMLMLLVGGGVLVTVASLHRTDARKGFYPVT